MQPLTRCRSAEHAPPEHAEQLLGTAAAATGKGVGVAKHCEDCGEHAEWQLTSVRENTVPPDVVETLACHLHRLDATENLLSRYGNVTVTETLG